MPKVYNQYHGDAPADAVYVGRPSKWGNPYRNNDREKNVADFERYLENNKALKDDVKAELKGKDLVCFCAPRLCHADILLRVANEED